MASNATSTPVIQQSQEVASSTSSGIANRRLEDRVACFLQSIERSPFERSARPRIPTGTEGNAVDVQRMGMSTADSIQTQSQVLVLVDNDNTGAVHPVTNNAPVTQDRPRIKRTRREMPREDPNNPTNISAVLGMTEPATVLSDSSYAISHAEVARVLQYYAPIGFQTSESPTRRISIDGALPQSTPELDVLRKANSIQGIAGIQAGGPAFLGNPSGVARMTALEKAKLDWETHITAMEQVFAANREQGLPTGAVSTEALQLLSQMVSNLYSLNSRLLYAHIQQDIEMHRRNGERIDAVFQGLAGVRKQNDDKRERERERT